MARERLELQLGFPTSGLNVVVPRTLANPQITVNCQNVWIFDTLEGRLRGGLRAGLSKYLTNTIDGANRIQDLAHTVVISNTAVSSSTLSVRTVKPFTICNGTIATFSSSNVVNAASSSGARSIAADAPFAFSAELFQRRYITDGTSYKIWIAGNNTATDWTASSGSLPGTDGTITCRLIEQWRSRLVLTGLPSDPHNWFMSAVGNALNWNYSPSTPVDTQAVQGGIGVVGKLGDVVNCVIPYSDDVLIFGGDHSIWQLSGDPGVAGTRFDQISDRVGMAFGRPYCRDARGVIYFFSSRCGVYRMVPGNIPESITDQSIAPLLVNTNLNTHFVRMAWDEERKSAHLFISPFTTGAATHFVYDSRVNAWLKTVFANTNYNPIAVHTFDGDAPGDRVLLLGGEDGHIRKFDDTVSTDDGNDITATVTIGPLTSGDPLKPIILKELQLVVDINSNAVQYEVLVGDTPEAALNTESSPFTADGTFSVGTTGRSQTAHPNRRGYYAYVKIGRTDAATSWSFEQLRVRVEKILSSRSRTIIK